MTPNLDDYDGIVAAAQAYIDGWNQHDAKKFKQAFDEDAWIFCIEQDGKLSKEHLSDEVLEGWARNDGRYTAELRILSVTQMGDAACVALAWGTEWFDFHSMVRVDGEWKITNKTASHRNR